MPVVRPIEIQPSKFKITDEAYTEDGILFNSDFLNDLTVDKAIEKAIEVIAKNNFVEKKITFRLKDWGVSRQRYWGCPIPIVYDEEGKVHPVPKSMLPVKLPENIDLNVKGNPLDSQKDWKEIEID